jgi:large subunit ribosomal protein L13
MKIYDAENQILGRLSSMLAKQLLKGEKIFVVNAEKAVLSANREFLLEHYSTKYKKGDVFKGPFFPKQPDRMLRRTVRGMLPWDRTKGRIAYKNLKVFIGVPEELKTKQFEKLKEADADRLKGKTVSLGEISVHLGAKKRW